MARGRGNAAGGRGNAAGGRGNAAGGRGRGGGANHLLLENPYQDFYDADDAKMKFPTFHPDKFHNWRDDFISFLDAKGCRGAINHDANDWVNMAPEKQERIQARVWHYLKTSLTDTYRFLTQEVQGNDPFALWNHISVTYDTTDDRRAADLASELSNFCWKDGDTIDIYLGRMMTLRSQYRQANIAHGLTEGLAKFHVKDKLPPEYDLVKPTIFANAGMPWAEMRRLLKDAEKDLDSRKRKTTTPLSLPGVQPQAFPHIKARSEAKKRRQFKKFLKHKRDSPSPSSKSDRCHFCGGFGHRRPQCKVKAWYRKHGFQGDQLHQVRTDRKVGKSFVNMFDDSSSESDSVESCSEESGCEENAQISFHEAHSDYVEEESHIADDDEGPGFSFVHSTKLLDGKWLLDSASTHHITTTKEFLTDCAEARVRITTGTKGHPIKATCRGVGQFRPIPSQKKLGTLTLQNVIYSPHASANLISIPKLDDAGCKTVVDNGVLTVYFDGEIVCQGVKENSGVYVLSSHYIDPVKDTIVLFHSVSAAQTLQELHERFGHVNPRTIVQMIRENVADGLPTIHPGGNHVDCPHCIAGKSTRQPFREEDGTTVDRLPENLAVGDEIHSDQIGPVSPTSHCGFRFVIIFIDAGSRCCFLYLMTSLSQTHEKYLHLRKLFKTQRGLAIKKFVCDGHRTFTSSTMESQFLKDGTVMKIRAPYCPQQNAVAERRIRTLLDMARTLLVHSGVPPDYWDEAIAHANYVRNRVLTRVLKKMTPHEKFWGKKPDLRWMKKFGCLAYVLTHKERRVGKFDAAAQPGVHLGASEKHSAHRILMLETKKICISRDVRFYEDVFPFRLEPSTDLTRLNPLDCPQPQMTPQSSSQAPYETPTTTSPSIPRPTQPSYVVRQTQETQSGKRKRGRPRKTPLPSGVDSSEGSATVGASDPPTIAEGKLNDGDKPSFDRDKASKKLREAIQTLSDERGPKERRLRRQSERFIETATAMMMSLKLDNVSVPKTLTEALIGADKEFWRNAAMTEFSALEKTGTMKKLTPELLERVRRGEIQVHGIRAILSLKTNSKGEITCGKVRVVVQGYTMEEGVDFDTTFAPVASIPSIRMVIAIACHNNWKVYHADCPNAYLNGFSQKTVLVRIPKHWNELIGSELGEDGDPAILEKSLYGAPDAGKNWNVVLHIFFIKQGYQNCEKEPCVYRKIEGRFITIFAIYVDDLFYTGNSESERVRIEGE